MKITTKIDINLNIKNVLKSQNRNNDISPQIMKETLKSIAVALSLIEPMIAYRFVKVHKVADEKIFIKQGSDRMPHVLNIGPNATLLHNAEMVMISVHTIGIGIDAKVKKLNNTGHYLKSFLLDCAGLTALNEVGKHGQKIIENIAKKMNWGVSASLSPGSLEGWDISDQKNLCSILDIKKAGITLSDSCMLIPFKTVSTLIGTGAGYTSKKVGSICKLCNFRNTCWKKAENKP